MQKRSNYLAIAIMFFLFMMISFVTGLQNPFGIVVKHQFNADNFMSQLGNAANFIAYAFMGLPAGFILTKKGYKFTSLLAVLIGFTGVLITFLSGTMPKDYGTWAFSVYLIGALVSGFSMCMLNTVVNPMLNTLGGGGNNGNRLIQFGGSLNSLSATICPVFVGYLLGNNLKNTTIANANPALFIAMAIFALAFIIIFFSPIPEPELSNEKERGVAKASISSTIAGALSYKHFVFGIIAIFVYVGVEVGIPNFANLYMTSKEIGLTAAVAGSIIAVYWFLMLVGRVLGGLVGDKVSSRVMVSTVSIIAICLLFAGIILRDTIQIPFPALTVSSTTCGITLQNIPICMMFFMLCGLCTSVMWGAIFNLAVEGLGKYTSIASGIFMVMVCGGGILPLIQGYVADANGYINSYVVIILAVAFILWFALMGSRIKHKSCCCGGSSCSDK